MSSVVQRRPAERARTLRRPDRRLIGLVVALVALVALNVAITPNFLDIQTLAVNISQVATIGIVALGMTLVIASGGIDLSVGAVMALAGALAPLIFSSSWGLANPQIGLAAAIVLPLVVAALCGVFNGGLVSLVGIQPIIATLILFISGRGIALVLTNGNLQTFANPGFTWLGTGRVLAVPVQGWLLLGLTLVVALLVRKTIYGRYLLAVGGNERAAGLAGAPVAKVKILTYTISATLAGLAGLIVVAINSASDAARIGQLMELDAIAASVVGGASLMGGRAPILGTLLGAVFIQLVGYTLIANGVPDEATLVVTAGIIVAAVWLQSGRRT